MWSIYLIRRKGKLYSNAVRRLGVSAQAREGFGLNNGTPWQFPYLYVMRNPVPPLGHNAAKRLENPLASQADSRYIHIRLSSIPDTVVIGVDGWSDSRSLHLDGEDHH